MPNAINHQEILDAFSSAVNKAVSDTRDACLWPNRMHEVVSAKDLIEKVKETYRYRVKEYFARAKCGKHLERELGQIYGSLTAHLQSIHNNWNTFAPLGQAGHRYIRMDELSAECRDAVVRAGIRHNELAADEISRALRHDAQTRSRAGLFCSMLKAHCDQRKLKFRFNDEVSSEVDFVLESSEVTDYGTLLTFHFTCTGYAGCSHSRKIGEFFSFSQPQLWHARSREALSQLAEQAFQKKVKFSEDWSTITFVPYTESRLVVGNDCGLNDPGLWPNSNGVDHS